MNRRSFLFKSFAATAFASFQSPALAGTTPIIRKNWIWMKRTGIDEEINIPLTYSNREHARRALGAFSWFFRDWKDNNEAITVDPRLIHILSQMQNEITRDAGEIMCIYLTSGYRTPERNRTIEGAALNSYHIQCRAADIIFKRHGGNVSSNDVGDYARRAGAGGIGYYGSRFTHIDTGRQRHWFG